MRNDMFFLLIIFEIAGGALAFGLTGVFLRPALLAVGFCLLAERSPSHRSAARKTLGVIVHSH